VVTDGVNTVSRIAFTRDTGATWTAQLPLSWSANDTVNGLVCTSARNCLVSATSNTNSLDLEVTHDGGTTWSARLVPTKWTSLTSLWCHKLVCNALASTASKSLVVRSSTFGRTWHSKALRASANALACVTLNRCVVAGETNPSSAWFALVSDLQVSVAILKYVPSPLVDVACGTKVCTAVGVSTVLAFRP
jgi:hypothetical protein